MLHDQMNTVYTSIIMHNVRGLTDSTETFLYGDDKEKAINEDV